VSLPVVMKLSMRLTMRPWALSCAWAYWTLQADAKPVGTPPRQLRAQNAVPARKHLHSNISDADRVPDGDEGVLCFLVHDTDMNSKVVRVLRWSQHKERYIVRVVSGKRALVQLHNLLPSGSRCRFTASESMLKHMDEGIERTSTATKAKGSKTTGFVNQTHSSGIAKFAECATPSQDVGCSEACDDCFISGIRECYAVCAKGCQVYCEQSTADFPGCSQDEQWRACTIPVGCMMSDKDPVPSGGCPPVSSKYRSCSSERTDGCPENYLY